MKMWSLPIAAFLCFSVATLLAQAAALAVAWARGGLTVDRWVQILAVAHDVDMAKMWREMQGQASSTIHEQVSYDEVLLARAQTSVDLDLREMAFDKGWIDIRNLESMLEQEKKRYSQLKQSFDQRLDQLRKGAVDSALQDVQRQIESIDPKLAKDQILRILDDEEIDPQSRMHFVVSMFKNLSLDKRKKILSTFRNDDSELERLHQILRQVRLGVPEVTLIRDTRRRLEEFKRES
ncbi:MAG: hypothetical protein ACC628_13380 [Pirellulaceae bacterium]